ncbi:MAG: 1-acyl-sn-glycerol-3-phosphate acyltransferase [Bacteroidales bacterium]|nr:1-acyl-sn-glycerol-3-phosphate acyltransferase [Bacteroidales bacterium]
MIQFFKKIGLFFVSLYIWTVLFVMAFIILITGLFLLFVSNARVVFRTVRAMLRFMFKIMFVKVDVEHPKDFNFNQSYIIMPNHITFWDIPVICSVLPNYTFGIEAESHFSWPIYGFFIKKYGTLPINRKNMLASFRTFETAAKNMKEKNASLLVFPEGHRSDDGKIQEFKKIPFKMAQIVKVPILPCGTSGLGTLAPKGFFITPCQVKIKYGEPVPVEDFVSLRPEVAAKMVRDKVIALSEDDIVPDSEKEAQQS